MEICWKVPAAQANGSYELHLGTIKQIHTLKKKGTEREQGQNGHFDKHTFNIGRQELCGVLLNVFDAVDWQYVVFLSWGLASNGTAFFKVYMRGGNCEKTPSAMLSPQFGPDIIIL